jgi:hypothetical protein
MKKILMFVTVLSLIALACGETPTQSPTRIFATDTLIPALRITITPYPTNPTVTPNIWASPTISLTPTRTPKTTPTIRPTQRPAIAPPSCEYSLNSFMSAWNGGTNAQRNNLINSCKGKWVNWTGTVKNVTSNGEVYIDAPGDFWGTIFLTDVSLSVSGNFSIGQRIHFTGRIYDIITVVGIGVFIDSVQIVP